MERSVEVLSILLFGVIGLSHILQPSASVNSGEPSNSTGLTGTAKPSNRAAIVAEPAEVCPGG